MRPFFSPFLKPPVLTFRKQDQAISEFMDGLVTTSKRMNWASERLFKILLLFQILLQDLAAAQKIRVITIFKPSMRQFNHQSNIQRAKLNGIPKIEDDQLIQQNSADPN